MQMWGRGVLPLVLFITFQNIPCFSEEASHQPGSEGERSPSGRLIVDSTALREAIEKLKTANLETDQKEKASKVIPVISTVTRKNFEKDGKLDCPPLVDELVKRFKLDDVKEIPDPKKRESIPKSLNEACIQFSNASSLEQELLTQDPGSQSNASIDPGVTEDPAAGIGEKDFRDEEEQVKKDDEDVEDEAARKEREAQKRGRGANGKGKGDGKKGEGKKGDGKKGGGGGSGSGSGTPAGGGSPTPPGERNKAEMIKPLEPQKLELGNSADALKGLLDQSGKGFTQIDPKLTEIGKNKEDYDYSKNADDIIAKLNEADQTKLKLMLAQAELGLARINAMAQKPREWNKTNGLEITPLGQGRNAFKKKGTRFTKQKSVPRKPKSVRKTSRSQPTYTRKPALLPGRALIDFTK